MRSIELGYDLGRAHAHLGRLREVKRVLELELVESRNAGTGRPRRAFGARHERAVVGPHFVGGSAAQPSAIRPAARRADEAPSSAGGRRSRHREPARGPAAVHSPSHGYPVRVSRARDGARRVCRLPAHGRGRRGLARNSREATPAPAPHDAEARHALRPQWQRARRQRGRPRRELRRGRALALGAAAARPGRRPRRGEPHRPSARHRSCGRRAQDLEEAPLLVAQALRDAGRDGTRPRPVRSDSGRRLHRRARRRR